MPKLQVGSLKLVQDYSKFKSIRILPTKLLKPRVLLLYNHAKTWFDAMQNGFSKHGIQIIISNDIYDISSYDMIVVWGFGREIREFKRRHPEIKVLVMERGYFNNRKQYTSVGWDGLNRNAQFYNKGMPDDRWRKHGVPIMPWKETGNKIIIAGQVQGDSSCNGLNLRKWYDELIFELKKIKIFQDYKLVFRPHPLGKSSSIPPSISISETLDNCRCIIAYSSNMVLIGILDGYPGIIFSDGSMAWPVAAHSLEIDNLVKPDRRQWAYDLAYTQWTYDEISNGECWDHIKSDLFC